LSGDFLAECKKASLDKKKVNSLTLFLPKNKRDSTSEEMVKHRLKDHLKNIIREKRKISHLKLVRFKLGLA